MFQTILLYMHASVITPTEPPGQTSLDVRKTAAFPELWAGRLPQLVVSRPAQRSLAFRPACSPGHLCDPLHQRLRRIRYLLRRSDCYRVERLVPGWESHPLRIAGFTRRTTRFDNSSAEAGADMHDIQQVLGHSSVAITEKHYAHFSPRKSARKILRVLEGGGTAPEMETKRKHA